MNGAAWLVVIAIALAAPALVWILAWRPLVRLCARAWGRSLFTLDGVDVRHAPRWFRLPGFRNAVATTLDRTILCKRIVQDPRAGPADVRLLRHEWHHVREWDRRGWRYLPVYLWRLVRHGYDDHPEELAADAAKEWRAGWEGGQ